MQGEAEAEIIFKKGDAEARAMNVKAEAFQEYNQAAVIDKLLTGLPEIVRALATPLRKVDKITIVSTGNGGTTGMHKLTGDMTEIAAQVPALFEALSGMPMSELLSKVRKIGDKAPPGRAARGVRGRSGVVGATRRGGTGTGVTHGSPRTRRDARPREPERSDRPRGRSREDDQAGDPRHGEPAAAGEDAGGHLDGRSAPAAEEAVGARGQGRGVDAQGGARGRQGAGRPRAGGAGALPELHEARRGLHAPGRGPAAAGGHAAQGARAARSEAQRGAREKRSAARAAPPRARARQGERRAAAPADRSTVAGFDRMQQKVQRSEAVSQAT